MKVELHHRSREAWCQVELANDRKVLGQFIQFLNADEVDALRIHGYEDERLPVALFSLNELVSLEFVGAHQFRALPSGLNRFDQLQELVFRECADLCDLSGVSELSALRALRVCGCDCFDALSDEVSSCEQLELLEISGCPNYTSLNASDLPRSLRVLDIRGCASLVVPNVADEDWPKLCSTNASEWSLKAGIHGDKLTDISRRLDHLCVRGGGAGVDDG